MLSSPEADHYLLGLSQIQDTVVSLTPLDQLAHLISIVGFSVVTDVTHYSCIIHKLDDVVGDIPWTTAVGQKGEEQWAEHISLLDPVFSMMVLEVLQPTRMFCCLSDRKSSTQFQRDVWRPNIPVCELAAEG